MAKVRFELNKNGVKELMQSADMQSVLKEYANAAVGRLGEGYEVSTYVGSTRANAEVAAVSYAAKSENLKDNSILKAVFGS